MHGLEIQMPQTLTNASISILVTVAGYACPLPQVDLQNAPALPITGQTHPWEETGFLNLSYANPTEIEFKNSLLRFAERMAKSTVEPRPEVEDFITEHFWELI